MKQKIMCSIGYCVSFVLCTSSNMLFSQVNKLQRLFHHRGSAGDQSIEVGNVVFYFSLTPKLIEEANGAVGEKTFTIPDIYVDPSIEQQIERFNALKTNDYTVHLEKVSDGLRVTISYNPKKIVFDWSTFVTIKNEMAIGFRVYNKKYLDSLNNKSRELLTLVSGVKRSRIIIDCGHGGDDCGAIGYNQLMEKDVTLEIGVSLAKLLRTLGNEVFLTRNTDTMVHLDDRTTYANMIQADLLISIHANAASNKNASGFELFYLPGNYGTTVGSLLTDNQTQNIEKLYNMRNFCSMKLASAIENYIAAFMKAKNILIVDRSIKKAVGQILAGSFMPAVLIEVGFVTNEQEAKLLYTSEYRNLLAQSICQGILYYFGCTA